MSTCCTSATRWPWATTTSYHDLAPLVPPIPAAGHPGRAVEHLLRERQPTFYPKHATITVMCALPKCTEPYPSCPYPQATLDEHLLRERHAMAVGKVRRSSALEEVVGAQQPRWQMTYRGPEAAGGHHGAHLQVRHTRPARD